MEFIEGSPLQRFFVQRYPLIDADRDPADRRRVHRLGAATCYAAGRARRSTRCTSAASSSATCTCSTSWSAGRRAGGPDRLRGRRAVAGRRPPGPRAPGFAAPARPQGFDVDRYALACLRLALFLPLTTLLRLDRAKAAQLAEVIAEHFPVPRSSWTRRSRRSSATRRPPRAVTPARRPGRRRRGAGPGRLDPRLARLRDRLPGRSSPAPRPSATTGSSPATSSSSGSAAGSNLAHGAAGVLYALDATGAAATPEYEEWLLAGPAPAPGTPLGFYDGLHGVAYVLDLLGHRHDAPPLLEHAASTNAGRSSAPTCSADSPASG